MKFHQYYGAKTKEGAVPFFNVFGKYVLLLEGDKVYHIGDDGIERFESDFSVSVLRGRVKADRWAVIEALPPEFKTQNEKTLAISQIRSTR